MDWAHGVCKAPVMWDSHIMDDSFELMAKILQKNRIQLDLGQLFENFLAFNS